MDRELGFLLGALLGYVFVSRCLSRAEAPQVVNEVFDDVYPAAVITRVDPATFIGRSPYLKRWTTEN